MKTSHVIKTAWSMVTDEESAVLYKALKKFVELEETLHVVSGERREDKELETAKELLAKTDRAVHELAND